MGGAAPLDAGPVRVAPPPDDRPEPADATVTDEPSPKSSVAATGRTAPKSGGGPAGRLIVAAGVLTAVAVIVLVLLGMRDGDLAEERPAIAAGNLTANPSFEDDTAGWDTNNSQIAPEAAKDAPDGENVMRVTLTGSGAKDYSIDDDPDTVQSSVRGRSYSALAWVKATAGSDDKPICIAIRERDGDDRSVGYAAGSVTTDAGTYRPVRVSHVAKDNGNTIDVFVFRASPELEAGDAFLVDAITMTEGYGDTSPGDCE